MCVSLLSFFFLSFLEGMGAGLGSRGDGGGEGEEFVRGIASCCIGFLFL